MIDIYTKDGFLFPAKLWLPLEEVEESARKQIENVSRLPVLASSLRVMPDCHAGMGVTIGSVLPTLSSAIIPNAVGVDIGCGVFAIKTELIMNDTLDKQFWRRWAGAVQREVPHGFNWHKQPQEWEFGSFVCKDELPITDERIAQQLGTLGGGNHFMEAQVDVDTDEIWLMVHSGSRRVGLEIANHYHTKAVAACAGKDLLPDLAYLAMDWDEGGLAYFQDMEWAIAYAKESRRRMGLAMLKALDCQLLLSFDCAHNYASQEYHDGKEIIVHRKGATSADIGELGAIPGSMGTSSYIVLGKGSEESLSSCSHGAGRTMSRTKARKTITEADFMHSVAGTHTSASTHFLDEAPAAYKDIDAVIARQSDLVAVAAQLRPIITIKGGGKDEG